MDHVCLDNACIRTLKRVEKSSVIDLRDSEEIVLSNTRDKDLYDALIFLCEDQTRVNVFDRLIILRPRVVRMTETRFDGTNSHEVANYTSQR